MGVSEQESPARSVGPKRNSQVGQRPKSLDAGEAKIPATNRAVPTLHSPARISADQTRGARNEHVSPKHNPEQRIQSEGKAAPAAPYSREHRSHQPRVAKVHRTAEPITSEPRNAREPVMKSRGEASGGPKGTTRTVDGYEKAEFGYPPSEVAEGHFYEEMDDENGGRLSHWRQSKLLEKCIVSIDAGYMISLPGVCEMLAFVFNIIAMILAVTPYQKDPEFAFIVFATLFGWVSAGVIFFSKLCLTAHELNIYYRIYVCIHLCVVVVTDFIATVLASEQSIESKLRSNDIALAVFAGVATATLIVDLAYNATAYFD